MAWIRDIVGQQAETAPLHNKLSSPGEKRPLSSEDNESQSRKKRRESLLNICTSKGESGNVQKNNMKIPTETAERQSFTVCKLCDLHFLKEVELEEHLYSLLHHRALEAEHGRNFNHECNLCCVPCQGLAEYVLHLRDERHKQAVDERKTEIEKNLITGPVYGLLKYRETFLCPPTKQIKAVPRMKKKFLSGSNKKPSVKNPSSYSNMSHSPNVNKGELYKPRDRSNVHSVHRSSPNLSNGGSQPWRIRPLMSVACTWNSDGVRPRHSLSYDSYAFKNKYYPPRPRAFPSPYFARFGIRDPKYSHRGQYYYEDDSYVKRNKFFTSGDTEDSISQRHPSQQSGDFSERTKPKSLLGNPRGHLAVKPTTNSNNDSTSSKSTLKTSYDRKSSKKFKKKKNNKSPISRSSEVTTPSSDKSLTPSQSLKLRDLCSNSKASRNAKIRKPTPDFKHSTSFSKPNKVAPKFPANKLRQINGNKRITNNLRPKKSDVSISVVSTDQLESPSLSCSAARITTPSTSSASLNAMADETSQLCKKFRSVIDSLTPPITSRALPTTAPSNDMIAKEKFCKQADVIEVSNDVEKSKTGDEVFAQRLVSTPNSLESPSVIREKLNDLVKRKETQRSEVSQSCSEEETSHHSNSSAEKLADIKTEDSADARKKDFFKPNLTTARSRLCAKQSFATDPENEKQTRLANLMLKNRNKPSVSQGRKTPGRRFGLEIKSQNNNQALDLNDTDLHDIVLSINEAEKSIESSPAKNLRDAPASMQAHSLEGNLISPHSDSSSQDRSSSVGRRIAESSVFQAAHDNHAVSTTASKSQVSSASPTEDLSVKLLHMSEREELLHKQDKEVKEKSLQLNQEMDHVNSLIEQLLSRRKQLEEAIREVDGEVGVIKSDLETIRQDRLSMLRASTTHSSSASNDKEESRTPSNRRMVRPGSCAHSTPTPSNILNLTSCIANNSQSAAFPDSQSTVANTSHNLSTSGPPNISLPLKNEHSVLVTPSQPSDPFPVPFNSIYYSTVPPSDSKPMTSSVDQILNKYLRDATTEREVTSSTTCQNPHSLKTNSISIHRSSDAEVTSTTPHRENHQSTFPTTSQDSAVKNAKSVRRKKSLPSDPHLAKLTREQPSSHDVTSSWVTAHDGSHDELNSLPDPSPEPTYLTSEQSEIALLRMRTLEHHSASVLCVYVTDCGKILSCSKDKTLCVVDSKNGQLLEKYDLPAIPFRTCIVCNGAWITLYVVFVNDEGGKTLLSESALHSVQICLQASHSDVESSQPRMKKLFDYFNCIMCIHRYQHLLYLGTRNGNVLIFCTKTNRLKDSLDCHSPHAVCCLITGRDGVRRVVCCGSSDCTMSVRDASDGLLLQTLLGHNKTINCLQLHHNLLYSGSSDRNVLVHNIQTGEIVHRFFNMHGGSIKSLFLHNDTVVTLCLDKSIRVLKSEPCRVTGSPKALQSLPLSMNIKFHRLEGVWDNSNILLAYAYVGCQDGKLQVVPLNQLAFKVPCHQSNVTMCTVKEEVNVNVGKSFSCLWNGCGASGFTSASSLLTHVGLFHATDSYKEKLNSCCLWENCAHYFSSDIDTALDVHLHMDKHISNVVKMAQNS